VGRTVLPLRQLRHFVAAIVAAVFIIPPQNGPLSGGKSGSEMPLFSRAAAERLAANAWNSRQMPQRIRRRNEKTRGDINESAEI
jgi:hypothetical protein